MNEDFVKENVFVKRKNPFIFWIIVFTIFIVFSVFFLKIYEFRKNQESGISSDSKITPENKENSEFGKLIQRTKTSESGETVFTESEEKILGFFVHRRDGGRLSPNFKLKDGEILLKFHKSDDGKVFYEVLDSKDTSFNSKFSVGDVVEAIPDVTSDRLFILIKDEEFDYLESADRLNGFKFPDDLQEGDRIIFVCEKPDCEESAVSWLVVLF